MRQRGLIFYFVANTKKTQSHTTIICELRVQLESEQGFVFISNTSSALYTLLSVIKRGEHYCTIGFGTHAKRRTVNAIDRTQFTHLLP